MPLIYYSFLTKILNPSYNPNNLLCKSLCNELIDHFRKIKLLTLLEEVHVNQLKTIISEQKATEIDRLVKLVKQEIENLPPKCKSVFTIGKLEGLTFTEIAEYQKITLITEEMHMSRAFEIIRKKVGVKTDTILFLLFGICFKQSKLFL